MDPLTETKRYRSCLDCDYLDDTGYGEGSGFCSFPVKLPACLVGASEGYKVRIILQEPFDYCECWEERNEKEGTT